MSIDPGTAIILAYVLVSMGVIIASLLAALVIGSFIDRLRERRRRQRRAQEADTGIGSAKYRTIETHREHLMDKLQIRSLAGLIKYAIREGLTSLDT